MLTLFLVTNRTKLPLTSTSVNSSWTQYIFIKFIHHVILSHHVYKVTHVRAYSIDSYSFQGIRKCLAAFFFCMCEINTYQPVTLLSTYVCNREYYDWLNSWTNLNQLYQIMNLSNIVLLSIYTNHLGSVVYYEIKMVGQFASLYTIPWPVYMMPVH